MWMTVDRRRFATALADNEATRAFAALLPLTLDMAELDGNEADLVALRDVTQPADVLWMPLFYHDLHTALIRARGATAADFNRPSTSDSSPMGAMSSSTMPLLQGRARVMPNRCIEPTLLPSARR